MSDLERDLEQEHAVGGQLVKGRPHSRAWLRLTRLADQRAHPGPVRLPPGRSMNVEALEEAADLRNYALWSARAGTLKPLTAAKVCAHLAAIAALLYGAD